MDITEVVKKLIGNINPIGESNTDGKRLQNLEAMCIVCDNLTSEINEMVQRNKHSKEHSIKEAVRMGSKFLEDLKMYNEISSPL